MTKKHILVVDDHKNIRDLLGSYLQTHGYRTSLAAGGEDMRTVLQREAIDLVVLDIMMPGEDGLSLCQELRDLEGPPVIMLSAMSEDADCVVGLEIGADDYVTKPFTPRVLLARVKAVLRRNGRHEPKRLQINTGSDFLQFTGWTLDIHQRHLVKSDGLVVPLSSSEFSLLHVFLSHPRQVLNRDKLLSLTKGREAQPFDRSVDNQISRLRKKIEKDPQNPMLIKTVWGGGYIFTEKAR